MEDFGFGFRQGQARKQAKGAGTTRTKGEEAYVGWDFLAHLVGGTRTFSWMNLTARPKLLLYWFGLSCPSDFLILSLVIVSDLFIQGPL